MQGGDGPIRFHEGRQHVTIRGWAPLLTSMVRNLWREGSTSPVMDTSAPAGSGASRTGSFCRPRFREGGSRTYR